MLMNRIETALVTSRPRRWLQRRYEVPVLLRFGGRLIPGTQALEVGCGSGYGSQLILERFGAASVDAVDLDPAMIHRARPTPGPLWRPGPVGPRQRHRPALGAGCPRR
jgi:ubiquinone/menaquinone biosynthesis C-methylase UbiE